MDEKLQQKLNEIMVLEESIQNKKIHTTEFATKAVC
jgi:hypothetical protein